MHTALRATSETLRLFLQAQLEAAPDLKTLFDASLGGTMAVSLATPEEMADATLTGLSVWLYRVVRDEDRLNDPPRRVSRDQLRPPPLPLRLHYLITPINTPGSSPGAGTEQVILGKVLQVFHDQPRLAGSDLSDDFVGTEVELRVRLETMSLEEITRVWDALEGSYQLSVSYEVTIVDIDSALQPERVAPVVTATPEYMVRAEVPTP